MIVGREWKNASSFHPLADHFLETFCNSQEVPVELSLCHPEQRCNDFLFLWLCLDLSPGPLSFTSSLSSPLRSCLHLCLWYNLCFWGEPILWSWSLQAFCVSAHCVLPGTLLFGYLYKAGAISLLNCRWNVTFWEGSLISCYTHTAHLCSLHYS